MKREMKKMFFSLGLLFSVSLATVVFTSCEGDDNSGQEQTGPNNPNNPGGSTLTSDVGVVINGVKWATRNVDAVGTFAAKPEDAGMFYQWNRKKAWPATGTVSGWDSSMPAGDTWEKINDPSPAGWRVPTLANIQKLFDTSKVTSQWITSNGVNGRKFTDKNSGNSIFLPAAGYRYYSDGTLCYAGSYGGYWSSTANGTSAAYNLTFGSGAVDWSKYDLRYNGFSVRSVAD